MARFLAVLPTNLAGVLAASFVGQAFASDALVALWVPLALAALISLPL